MFHLNSRLCLVLYSDPSVLLTHPRLAETYGTSTFQLAIVNEASIDENCDNLTPGETVCLGIEGQDCTKVYTVVPNE